MEVFSIWYSVVLVIFDRLGLQVIHLAGVSTNKTHGKNSTKNGNIFRNKQFILSRKKIMERMKEIKGINEWKSQ